MNEIFVYGAGLAGCEAAYQIAQRGLKVRLFEMKPQKKSPAHTSDLFAELVCSNSLRSAQIFNAVGLLKEEMRRLDSLILKAADATRVEAGASLAVDRTAFSGYITDAVRSHPNIVVEEKEITSFDTKDSSRIQVIATGPLTSPALSEYLGSFLGHPYLSFFDASAPIVDAQSIDHDRVYALSRYGKGEASYLNCPFSKEEYEIFYDALIHAEEAKLHDFDRDLKVFEGCMPVEVMAKRGVDTLRFGPMKPVGLPDPKTGRDPYAVVQLRRENNSMTMYNLVGFQTHLTIPEQKRVFSLIPGLENAVFLRYGVMHRNTFIDSPRLLTNTYSMRSHPNLFFAGQMTGVEGYVESASSGLLAGINAAHLALGKEPLVFPQQTVIGSLAAYISDPNVSDFQPMNANFGLVAPPETRIKGGKRARYDYLAQRALDYFDRFAQGSDQADHHITSDKEQA
ncbi:MAG: methylenetetrahydrofolate--tRNA-(uracil(54)-C(5))-methyltransferase (FADH(2)-oxidizing) TrmFO [Ruminococcaceae bacterium]|nr:methylenetetrahydrofolate--tRNA-(uracil(54)-C(5))-methyltransferase (FADH(2)-oxidizing) TrmFO [Oscillospiraceae bacterium]